MLKQLAGPFPLIDPMDDDAPVAPGTRFGWHDSVGFITTAVVQGINRGVLVNLDGSVYARNSFGIEGWIGQDLPSGGLCVVNGTGLFPKLNLRMLRGEGTYVTSPTLGGFNWNLASDRYVRAFQQKVLTYDAEGDASVVEYDFDPGSSILTNTGLCSPSPRQGTCFFAFPDGYVAEYDLVAKEAVGTGFRRILANKAAFYSPHLGVFVAIHQEADSSYAVRVWADEEQPSTLSAPTALDDVFPGRVTRWRTRATGSEGRACAGEVVEWASSFGTVLDPTSTTDADGYATTRVMLAPDLAAATDLVTVQLRF